MSAVPIGLEGDQRTEFIQTIWWEHDAYWFAACVRLFGAEAANEANLIATERAARSAALRLRRMGLLRTPETPSDLEQVFRSLWRLFFPRGLYQDSEFVWHGHVGEWVCTSCHAYEQVRKAGLLTTYRCGCYAFREGVRKALKADFKHEIVESLVQGHGRCVVRFSFFRRKA